MDIYKILLNIIPEQTYSVNEAAKYLGIHRNTLYAYVCHPDRPLPFIRHFHNDRMMFRGVDLIEYKQDGLPKKGRKKKDNSHSEQKDR